MAQFSLVPNGRGNNYIGMFTRSIVFSGTLFIFLTTTALSIAAIIVPNWLAREFTAEDGSNIQQTYGLHRRCSNRPNSWSIADFGTNLQCEEFPRYGDCRDNRYFCSMWRTVGFLMSFGVVLEGMTIAAFLILLAGGKQKREQGWGVMAALAALAAAVQAVGMAIIAYLYENDDRFLVGDWSLDKSWVMTTVSWILQGVCALAITLAALYLPSEGGYELIPDRRDNDEA